MEYLPLWGQISICPGDILQVDETELCQRPFGGDYIQGLFITIPFIMVNFQWLIYSKQNNPTDIMDAMAGQKEKTTKAILSLSLIQNNKMYASLSMCLNYLYYQSIDNLCKKIPLHFMSSFGRNTIFNSFHAKPSFKSVLSE